MREAALEQRLDMEANYPMMPNMSYPELDREQEGWAVLAQLEQIRDELSNYLAQNTITNPPRNRRTSYQG